MVAAKQGRGMARKLVLCLLVAAALLFGALGVLTGVRPAAAAEGATQAYYLGMDENTHGEWYDPDSVPTSLGNDYTYRDAARLYGNDGFVMTYAKVTGDGQPVKNLSQLSDFTSASTVHYAAWPSYVTNIESPVESVNDTPHGYWNYAESGPQPGAHGSPGQVALLSPEPSVWSRKSVWQCTRDYVYMQVDVNDDQWHKVSVYVGDDSGGTGGRDTWYQYVRIMDLGRNVLASVTANKFDQGIYYSFAVKGSFIMNIQQIPGTIQAVYSAVFFDPLMPEDMDAADYAKSGLKAELEGARTVHLSWEQQTASKTTVYRKETDQPDSAYELIATINNPAQTKYTDTATQVARNYTYLIGGGVADADYANVTHYIVPTATATVQTAPYWLVSVEFDELSYYSDSVTDEITVTAEVRRKVGLTPETDTDEEYPGLGGEGEQPFAEKEIVFSLDGDLVYDTSQLSPRPNMKVELGRATTDKNGRVTFTFTPEYAGSYTLIATSPLESIPGTDEMRGYDDGVGTALLDITVGGWEAAPVITAVSDAIKPGEAFSVMGTGIDTNGDFRAAIAPNAGTVDPAFDAERAGLTYLTPEVSDTTYASGAMFVLPENFDAGVYDVWVSADGHTWSQGKTINAARPLYISQEAAYEGLEIEVVGRNFFGDEFGLAQSSREDILVKLVDVTDGSKAYTVAPSMGVRYTAAESVTGVAVEESNPYRLTFVVPASVPAGEYEVCVANDGVNFRSLAAAQTLQIVEKATDVQTDPRIGTGNDPLGLGVYWAQDLNYSEVRALAERDGFDEADDTATIQGYIDELAEKNGGVVYLPEGDFYVDHLVMKSNVMIVGAGANKTTLFVRQNAASPTYFIQNSGSNNGIARLAIELDLDNGSRIPDMYLNFADEPDSSSDVDIRVHSNVFIKDIVMNFPYDVRDPFKGASGTNRGLGILLSGKKNFVIDDNEVTGFFAVLHRGFVNEYVSLRNNVFRVQRDVMHVMASYAFIENTALIGSNNDGHGWSARSDCYFGNNYIYGVGPTGSTETGGAVGEDGQPVPQNNNGEVIMLEVPGGQINYGDVLGATAETITLDRLAGKELGSCDYNYFAVVITDGTGMGQVRYIERYAVQNENPDQAGYMETEDERLLYGNTYKLRAGQAWDVLPDQTSGYAIYVPIEHATIYRNTAEHCAKSILLYSQCHDALVAENTMNETEGISLYSTVQSTSGIKGTNFFVRIERNNVTGVSPASNKGGIGVMTQRNTEGAAYAGLVSGGISIRYNTLKNVPSAEEYGQQSETPETNGIYVHTDGQANVVEDVGDIRFTIIEGNLVDTSAYGVYIDNRAQCTIIRNNEFKNIEQGTDVYNLGAAGLSITARMTFDLQGGSFTSDAATQGTYAANAPLPSASKEGYGFWGWATSAVPAAGAEPITAAPTSNATLYAVYGYNVQLVWNCPGREDDVFRTVVVLPGATVGELPVMYRTDSDAELLGWYLDAACTQEFDAASPVEGNMTLYARWTDTVVPEERGCGGCGGSAAGGATLVLAAFVLAAGVLACVRLGKNKK